MKILIPGRHHDVLRSAGGGILAEFEGSNRVVLRALDLIGALLTGSPPVRGLTFLALGEGDPAWGDVPPEPPITTRGLAAEIYRQPLTPESFKFDEPAGRLEISIRIPSGAARGTLREFGVFGGDASERPNTGYLFGYRRHAPIIKAAEELERTVAYDLNVAGWLRSAVPVIAGLLSNAQEPPGIRFWAEGEGDPAWDAAPPVASRDTGGLVKELFRTSLTPLRDLEYDPARLTLTARTLLDYNSGRGMLRETGLLGGSDGKRLLAYGTFRAIDHRQLSRLHRSFSLRLTGTEDVPVPVIAGLEVKPALDQLAAVRLSADPLIELEDAPRAGRIIETLPPAGSTVPSGSRVEVHVGVTPLVDAPGVLGLSQPDAEEAIRAAGLVVGPSREIESEIIAGTVLEQKPAGGTRVPAGSAVRLAISTAPLVEVPSLVKLHPDEAAAVLASVRLRLGSKPFATERSDITPGLIASQVPVPGVRILRDSSVAITLAVPQVVAVPNVTGKIIAEASDLLKEAGKAALRALGKSDSIPGLAAGRQIEQPSTLQAGLVLSQQPAAGVEVALFSTVDLTVAIPAFATAPDLVGLTRAEAEAQLTALRLTLRKASGQQSNVTEGTVLEQNPRSGMEVPVETPFDLVIATPVLVRVPALVGMSVGPAGEALRSRGLVLGTPRAGTGQGAEGTIIALQPAAGTEVRFGTEVIPTVIGSVNIPNVVALDRAAAETALRNAALIVNVQLERSANRLGSVIRQVPAAGTNVRFGSAVAIVVAEGVSAPAVVGLTTTSAQASVQALGLVYLIGARKPSEKAPDTVLDQKPQAGTVVPLSTQVVVDLARGVAVPAVTGTTLADAETAIERVGLKMSVLTAGATRDDRVATQSPAANTQVGLGSVVQLTTTDNLVTVPNLKGKDSEDARSQLDALRLVTKMTFKVSTLPDGIVIAQTPAAGARVRPGSAVTLTISQERFPRKPF